MAKGSITGTRGRLLNQKQGDKEFARVHGEIMKAYAELRAGNYGTAGISARSLRLDAERFLSAPYGCMRDQGASLLDLIGELEKEAREEGLAEERRLRGACPRCGGKGFVPGPQYPCPACK